MLGPSWVLNRNETAEKRVEKAVHLLMHSLSCVGMDLNRIRGRTCNSVGNKIEATSLPTRTCVNQKNRLGNRKQNENIGCQGDPFEKTNLIKKHGVKGKGC